MPRGPNGEKRPRDPIALAVHIAKIATGQMEDELPSDTRKGGLVGGPARAKALSPERRSEIARMGQRARREKE